jgi:hypothetical protein
MRFGKLIPKRQVLPVTHLKRGRQYEVRCAHAGETQPRPLASAPSAAVHPKLADANGHDNLP